MFASENRKESISRSRDILAMAGSRRRPVANKIHDVREYNGHSGAARKEGPMPFLLEISSRNLSRARALPTSSGSDNGLKPVGR